MKYKVFFHRGNELLLKTIVSKGRAWLDDVGCISTVQMDSQFQPATF